MPIERNTPRPLHQADPAVLARVAFILIGTSHPGNVGSAARAMKTMGLSDLRLVSPRFADVCSRPEAIAFASGATDVLASARHFDSLAEALADTVMAVAVSAEPREFGPLPAEPDAAAAAAFEVLAQAQAHRVAFVFGAERTGLSIESVQACGLLTSIPASPVYSSLNLAQAIQILAFCLRQTALRRESPRSEGGVPAPTVVNSLRQPAQLLADQRAIEGLMAHLERALTAIGFLDPQHPKKLMPRLRRLILRARLGAEEVDLIRGICKLMERRNRPG